MMRSSTSHKIHSIRLYLLGIVTICVMSSWAKNRIIQRDSLSLQKELDKLNTYEQKDSLLVSALDSLDTNSPAYLTTAQKLWDLAKVNMDYNNMAYAGYSLSIYYYNNTHIGKTKELLEEMRPLLSHMEDCSYYFYVMHLVITEDIEAANFEYALANVQRMEQEMISFPNHDTSYILDQTWGRIHGNFKEYTQAIQSYHQALEKLPKEDWFGGRIDIQSELLSLYIELEMYDKTDSLLEATSKYYGVNLGDPDKSQISKWDNDYVIDTYCNAAYIYLKRGKIKQAKSYIDHAKELLLPTTYSPYQSYLHKVTAEYYSTQQDSAKAMSAINKALTCCTIAELGWSDYILLIQNKAELQIQFNDKSGAATTYARQVEFTDSLSNMSANQQYTQLKRLYNLEAQHFENQKREHKYLLLASLIGLITLLVALRQWRASHAIRKRELESVQQIKRARATADKANKAKYDFLNTFNHNIRTPLNAVVGFTDLMITTPDIDSSDLQGYATCIHRNSQHILTTVSNLLELSRMESNMVQLIRESISVENFVESIRLRMEIKEIGAFIIRDKVKLYDKMMTLDTHRFGQLFDSFVSAYGTDELTPEKVIIETDYQFDNSEKRDYISFKITGSSLIEKTDKPDKGQERSVRNTINSIVVERTGGQYIQTNNQITITLPLQS